jgi:hypothetical protein
MYYYSKTYANLLILCEIWFLTMEEIRHKYGLKEKEKECCVITLEAGDQ